jgi:hypothetical protein
MRSDFVLISTLSFPAQELSDLLRSLAGFT